LHASAVGTCAAGLGVAAGASATGRRRRPAALRADGANASREACPRTLELVGDDFVLDGRPHRIVSGSVSYFRVLPAQWRDRLEKLKALGCNAAEVYVPWNLHEPAPGQFRFDGRRDLPGFLSLCRDMDIDVLLRPGPYICAEWDFGGLPWWLLRRSDPVPLRSADEEFLGHVEAWWCRGLLPRVEPFLAANGGPVLAMQVENEYGYWGRDAAYLEGLRDMLRRAHGPACPLLFTSDGTFWPDLQANGGVEGALRTANFGSEPATRLAELRQALPKGPLCNMEFWVGWFDAWGSMAGKSYRAPDDVAQTLRETLSAGASVNFFVFHGGTSFGFCGAGANLSNAGQYEPQVTSYDYGGLLDEAGDVTDKYLRCREVLADFLVRPELLQREFSRAARLPASPPLELEASLSLEAALPALAEEVPTATSSMPLSAEQLGCGYGYVLYSTMAPVRSKLPLRLGDQAVRDFASVMADGRVLGTVYRNDSSPGSREFALPEECSIDILVELMGRVNFGPAMLGERKGLVGTDSVRLGSPFTGPLRAVLGWRCQALPMGEAALARLPWGAGQDAEATRGRWARGPRFFLYALYVSRPADGFLRFDGFRKGFACVNGFNLGRYWEVGPQLSLYVPGPLLRRGRNEVLVFDIDSPGDGAPRLRVVPEAVWGNGALPEGAKEAVTNAASGLAQAAAGVGEALRQITR